MADSSVWELIHHSSFARDLSTEQCKTISELATESTLQDGDVLIDQGKTDDTLHIVAKGRLAVERDAGAGEAVTLHILSSGDLAGELGFVDGSEHTATLRAVGETTVLSLKRGDLESLLGSQPEVVYGVMRGIIRTVHRILGKMNLQWVELSNYISKTHGRY